MKDGLERRRVELLGATLAAGGSSARKLSSLIDLGSSAGPGYVLRRLRAANFGALDPALRHGFYLRLWSGAAADLGAEARDLGGGFTEVRAGELELRLRHQLVPFDDPVALALALDKPRARARLAAAGVPVPDQLEFELGSIEPALRFLAAATGPCVVKPARDTGGGDGATAGVDTPLRLRRACLRAGRSATRLVIERQLPGDVFRLLLLDGELIDVVRNRPPHVTGDGRTTIEGLIGAENRRRIEARGERGLTLLGVCLDSIFTLERQGLRLSSVLEAGRRVPVQTVTNDNGAEDAETWRRPVAPEVVAAARDAATAVGVRLAGVDVITPDIAVPLETVGGGVAEVNGTPGLHHHRHVADAARATRVELPILERALDWAAAGAGRGAVGIGA